MARVVPQNPPGLRGLRRDPALVPLSRDHHFALRHALWLRRGAEEAAARGGDPSRAALDYLGFYRDELIGHMADEEEALLPLVPGVDPPGAQRLRAEHEQIHERTRELRDALEAGRDPRSLMAELGSLLADHVRFEERGFFMAVQERLGPDAMRAVGEAIARHRAARSRPL